MFTKAKESFTDAPMATMCGRPPMTLGDEGVPQMDTRGTNSAGDKDWTPIEVCPYNPSYA